MKKLIIALLSLLFWSLVFEGAARLARGFMGDSLDQTKSVLSPHKTLGWKQYPNLNTTFFQTSVKTNSFGLRSPYEKFDSQKFKILILGPSSAFGWGVEEKETYGSLVQSESSLNAQIINASQIGYSSFQGVLLSQEDSISQLEPDLVIIAYGVNDIDRHRFYFQSLRPDSEELSSQKEVGLLRLMDQSALLSFVPRILFKSLSKLDCPKPIATTARHRVSFKELESNLLFLINKYKDKVLLVDTGHHYKDNPKLAKMNLTYYQKAKEAAQKKSCESAREYLKKAQDTETYRISADLKRVNQVFDKLSKKLNIPLTKASELIVKEEHFVDPIHPSALGHKILGMDIIKKILENR